MKNILKNNHNHTSKQHTPINRIISCKSLDKKTCYRIAFLCRKLDQQEKMYFKI